MSAAAAQLHTDHVNLLIFRYLQESGFENAALAFVEDWRRPAEHRDPESYPFARAVQRNELVSVIQNGLHHDDLLVRKCNKERRFKWTGEHPRDSIERRDGPLENGAGSRPPSSKGRKGRPPVMRAPNDFPTPAPKRPRRSEGSSEAQTNGDAMDVDNASADAEGDEDAEAASPALQSEPEPMEVAERYDSMDVATQTEIKTSPKTSTMYWKVDRPESTISQSIWNPESDPKNSHTLLTVGESLCRFYQVPDTMDDANPISHIDVPSLPVDSIVTASAWCPDGNGIVYAFDRLHKSEDGANTSSDTSIVEHHRDGASTVFQFGPPLLEPAAIVTDLQYSPNAEYFLALRTNNKRGLVQIWKTPNPDSDAAKSSREPVAWRIFDDLVSSVAWTEDDNFLVAGNNGLSARYQVDATYENAVGTVTAGTVALRGLISHNSNIVQPDFDWDYVRFDRRHNVTVFASVQAKKMIVTPDFGATQTNADLNSEIDLPEELISLEFRPWHRPEDETDIAVHREQPSLLAAGFADGTCIIYNISQSREGYAECSELAAQSLLDGPAATLAWSPSGEEIAIGNAERVQIWTAESLKRKNGIRHMPEAAVIWKPAPEPNAVNGEKKENEVESEPSLSWSADGESLAFAAEKQIAVIRFRPSLRPSSTTDNQDVNMNGRLSP